MFTTSGRSRRSNYYHLHIYTEKGNVRNISHIPFFGISADGVTPKTFLNKRLK